jgi:hypothetical protein
MPGPQRGVPLGGGSIAVVLQIQPWRIGKHLPGDLGSRAGESNTTWLRLPAWNVAPMGGTMLA